MKHQLHFLLIAASLACASACAQDAVRAEMPRSPAGRTEVLSAPSHRAPLQVRLLHELPVAPNAATPVLFVHGASFPSELAFAFRMGGQSWMDLMALHGYDTYALDFPGYGLSDRYPEMAAGGAVPLGRAREASVDLDHAIDAIRARTGAKRVTIIAHSWGGSVAARYAGLHPEKIGSLVLFAAITGRRDATPPASLGVAYEEMTPQKRISLMAQLVPAGEAAQLSQDVYGAWGAAWLASDSSASERHSGMVRFPAGPEQDIEDLRHGRTYYDPAAIRAPTLLIRGEWDTSVTDADFRELYGQLTGAPYRKYVVVEHGTHVAHLEAARHQLFEQVLQFLGRR